MSDDLIERLRLENPVPEELPPLPIEPVLRRLDATRTAAERDTASPRASAADAPRASRRPGLRGLTTAVAFVASIALVVVVVAVFALVGSSRQANTHATGRPSPGHQARSDRAQAQRLYAPVAVFYRTTTPAERAQPAHNQVVKTDTERVNACQAPYQKQMFEGFVVGRNSRYQLYSLYEHGTLLESYQSRVAPVAFQLTLLAQSWAGMRLSDPLMQRFAHAMAAEFYATLRAPKFDPCAFIDGIARHHFSLAWAQRSSYGRAATSFWNQISAAGNTASAFWAWICPGGKQIPRDHLLTKAQLSKLANLPGEIS